MFNSYRLIRHTGGEARSFAKESQLMTLEPTSAVRAASRACYVGSRMLMPRVPR
ncbi:hypothetical protein M413DRAFT_447646 [Hebeloma cylindrosporum]|uniref:Uncharacterized protein n=1 Tax=Hebeloma cylindrosporum TaxID=76867 RepID=A0A0C2XLT6_HEBCY|nr:hypothetical protein M413DRAFT_447646 [Hebeloma cylindrosporum h7]